MGYQQFNVENVNFNEDCLVIFTFETDNGEFVRLIYNRPQYINDYVLGDEAMTNSKDMLDKNPQFKELMSIYIARSRQQYNSHMVG